MKTEPHQEMKSTVAAGKTSVPMTGSSPDQPPVSEVREKSMAGTSVTKR